MMRSEEEIRKRLEYLERSAEESFSDNSKISYWVQSQVLKWALGDID